MLRNGLAGSTAGFPITQRALTSMGSPRRSLGYSPTSGGPAKRTKGRAVGAGSRQIVPSMLTDDSKCRLGICTGGCRASERACVCGVHLLVYITIFRVHPSSASFGFLKYFYSHLIKMILQKNRLISCKQANNQQPYEE